MDVFKQLFASILILSTFILPLNADTNKIKSKELYLKYLKYPPIIYQNQRFSIELEARILSDENDFDIINTKYDNGKYIEQITGDVIWKNEGNHRYTSKIVYKVTSYNFRLPTIKLDLIQSNENNQSFIVNSITVKPPKIKFSNIISNQNNFSNIIATDMIIKDIQTKQFNNKMLMVVCNIETSNGNLEEFYLNQFKDQGLNSFSENYPIQDMYYYMIIPSHIDNIKFNYYNPDISKFIEVNLPIVLEENLVSTQTNLNPNNSGLLLYKQIASIVFLMISIILFIITRHKFTIVLMVLFLLLSISLLMPNQIIKINKGTKIYILPTALSTIYKITNKDNNVEKLMENDKFIKILFENKNIGWVKKQDVK